MVSVKDVAAAAGVSVGTVSNVLNRPDRVLPETVARVREVIAELGYVPNDAARQLRAGRSQCIGMIVPDLRNPFYADLVRGAEDRAAEEGLAVLVTDSRGDVDQESAHLLLFERQRTLGVVMSPLGSTSETARTLIARGTPVVLVDASGNDPDFSSVSVDDVEGGRLAVAHLLNSGRRRIAFVGGSGSVRQVADRHAGARSAAESRGAPLEWIETGELSVRDGRAVGGDLLRRPAADRPDALFAANDLVALGLLQALHMSGEVRVPDDIAVLGYDDIDFAASAVVALSSVRQPAGDLGARAVELLLRPATAPQHIAFRPELVRRISA